MAYFFTYLHTLTRIDFGFKSRYMDTGTGTEEWDDHTFL